nr:hypothetical protein Datr000062 [Darna trima granulovirus]
MPTDSTVNELPVLSDTTLEANLPRFARKQLKNLKRQYEETEKKEEEDDDDEDTPDKPSIDTERILVKLLRTTMSNKNEENEKLRKIIYDQGEMIIQLAKERTKARNEKDMKTNQYIKLLESRCGINSSGPTNSKVKNKRF